METKIISTRWQVVVGREGGPMPGKICLGYFSEEKNARALYEDMLNARSNNNLYNMSVELLREDKVEEVRLTSVS